MTRLHIQSARGFTIVELVVVIMIISILSAVAMPRFFGNRAFAERGYYEELVGALRFAQKTAVASGCPVRVTVAAGGYAADQQAAAGGRCDPGDASWSMPVRLSDGQSLTGTAPSGVAATPAVAWVFDSLGRTNLGADTSIAVGAFTFTVRAASGYVDTP